MCGGRITSRDELSLEFARLYCQCSSAQCGHTRVANLTFFQILSPSALAVDRLLFDRLRSLFKVQQRDLLDQLAPLPPRSRAISALLVQSDSVRPCPLRHRATNTGALHSQHVARTWHSHIRITEKRCHGSVHAGQSVLRGGDADSALFNLLTQMPGVIQQGLPIN